MYIMIIILLHSRLDTCSNKILEGSVKQDCRFLSEPLCWDNFLSAPTENDAGNGTSSETVELHCATVTLAL